MVKYALGLKASSSKKNKKLDKNHSDIFLAFMSTRARSGSQPNIPS